MSATLNLSPSLSGHGSGFLGWIGGLTRRVAAEWKAQRDLRHLEELGPDGLKDIGIGPGSLEGAVRFGRYRGLRDDLDQPRCNSGSVMPMSWTEWR